MKKVLLLSVIIIFFGVLYIFAPPDTSLNGYEGNLKTFKFGRNYYTEITSDIPSDTSFQIFGRKFSSKENIEKIGGKYEVVNEKVFV